jgi:hypothetical protein
LTREEMITVRSRVGQPPEERCPSLGEALGGFPHVPLAFEVAIFTLYVKIDKVAHLIEVAKGVQAGNPVQKFFVRHCHSSSPR